jgi:hypothetical protein
VEAERENFLHFMELSEDLCQIVALEDGQEVDGTMRQMVTQYDGITNRLKQYSQVMR